MESFTNPQELHKHQRICKKGGKQKASIAAPRGAANRLTCPHCDRNYKRETEMLTHMRHKHGIPFVDDGRLKIYRCSEENCEFETLTSYTLRVHSRRHGDSKPFLCDHCGKDFKSKYGLSQHVQSCSQTENELSATCDRCGKELKNEMTLKSHIHRVHGGKKYPCSECSHTSYSRSNLASHMMAKHGVLLKNTKKFSCDYCEFVTVSKSLLDAHIRRHTGESVVKCDVCDKGFPTRSALTSHMKWHKAKRAYACPYEGCKFATAIPTSLKRHIRVVHTHKDEKPFACNMCAYRTNVRGNLHLHLRNVHKIKVLTNHRVRQVRDGEVVDKENQNDNTDMSEGHHGVAGPAPQQEVTSIQHASANSSSDHGKEVTMPAEQTAVPDHRSSPRSELVSHHLSAFTPNIPPESAGQIPSGLAINRYEEHGGMAVYAAAGGGLGHRIPGTGIPTRQIILSSEIAGMRRAHTSVYRNDGEDTAASDAGRRLSELAVGGDMMHHSSGGTLVSSAGLRQITGLSSASEIRKCERNLSNTREAMQATSAVAPPSDRLGFSDMTAPSDGVGLISGASTASDGVRGLTVMTSGGMHVDITSAADVQQHSSNIAVSEGQLLNSDMASSIEGPHLNNVMTAVSDGLRHSGLTNSEHEGMRMSELAMLSSERLRLHEAPVPSESLRRSHQIPLSSESMRLGGVGHTMSGSVRGSGLTELESAGLGSGSSLLSYMTSPSNTSVNLQLQEWLAAQIPSEHGLPSPLRPIATSYEPANPMHVLQSLDNATPLPATGDNHYLPEPRLLDAQSHDSRLLEPERLDQHVSEAHLPIHSNIDSDVNTRNSSFVFRFPWQY